MKKLMLFSFFPILFLNSYSQDTICSCFTVKDVFGFVFQTSEPIAYDLLIFYTIQVGKPTILKM